MIWGFIHVHSTRTSFLQDQSHFKTAEWRKLDLIFSLLHSWPQSLLFIKKKATMFCIGCEDYIPQREHLIEARSAATNMNRLCWNHMHADFDKGLLNPQPQATNLNQTSHKNCSVSLCISDVLDNVRNDPEHSFVFHSYPKWCICELYIALGNVAAVNHVHNIVRWHWSLRNNGR